MITDLRNSVAGEVDMIGKKVEKKHGNTAPF
jgi:hypothetical protein